MGRYDAVPIADLSRVSATMFRGAAPGFEGVEFLRSIGVRAIVDLRAPGPKTRREHVDATTCGLSYFNIPMSYFYVPDAVVAVFLAIALHSRYQPIFVHCGNGDRTGALIGIYRVAVEGWPFEWAYREMQNKGFRAWQLPLKLRVEGFAQRMGMLAPEERIIALQELVEHNVTIA